MKFILFVGLILSIVACGGNSEGEVGQYTTIELDEEFDAGTVAKGEIIKADIRIKNVGDYPLVIANVKGSCSCTVTDYEQDPIAPGASTVIKAEVNTDNINKGIISKSVSITANTRPSTTNVVIKARVID